ncbi:hypothetical protein UFOVP713_31 [uncultured Caudovirales phage]|uniref:Large polyvalent protein associated domain-containing protein n=1 Tax=uncultured Caudovirales phage TaxID=2100421 RepID=A0A6J5NGI6_9CAUD|nr:hypothetical protein UFOVP713_31 [uncultured Caudovirales phage]
MATYISEDEAFGKKTKPADSRYISQDEAFGVLPTKTETYTGPTKFEAKVAPEAKDEYGIKTFLSDVSKQFSGAIAGGTLKAPAGIETGTRGAVRGLISGEALEATPAGKIFSIARSAFTDLLGIRTIEQQAADKQAASITIDRAMSSIPTIPGTRELANYGDKVQKDIQSSLSETGKSLLKGSTPTGNIFKGELSFGEDPTLTGYALQASSVFGSFAPVLVTVLATRNPSAVMAVGGGMAAGEAADTAKEYISKLSDDQLLEISPYYKAMIDRGVPKKEARQIVTDKASENGAMLQGMIAAVGDRITGNLLTGAYDNILGRIGGRTVAGRTAAGIVAGAAEEAVQEVSEGLASDIGIRSQITTKELGEDSAANLILGALGGAGPGGIRGAMATPERQIAAEINAGVAQAQPAGVNEAAIRALNPQTYDQTIVTPQQTVNRSAQINALSQATSVDEAVTAAADLAGTIEGARSYAPSQAPVAAAPLAGTTPTFDGLPIAPAVGGVTPQAEPVTAAPEVVTPEITPVTTAPTAVTPEIAPVTTVEDRGVLPTLAPRPQRIQGKAVADLSDDDLRAVVEDDKAPAITRRGAQIELDARAKEVAPAPVTQAAAPVTPEVSRETTENFIDIPADTSTAALPDADAEPVDGVAAADEARAVAQEAINRWAASENRTDAPVLNPAPAEEDAAVNQIAQALNSQLGGRVYAFHDTQPDAVNGFALGGTAFVNTALPDFNIANTSLHEFKHTVEQIAEAEARQGLTNTPAQQFTASIDSIFTDMTEEGKRAYAENFLHKEELDAIADPAAREQRLQELLQAPLLVSEMTADFLGNRATDKAFWRDVARADPTGFKGFVDKWVSIIDNLLSRLQGRANQGLKEASKVDQYVRDLKKAKAVARDALIAYRRGRLTAEAQPGAPAMSLREGEGREANIPGRGEGVQPSPERAGPAAGEAGRSDLPSYGEAREGAISVVGRHYSPRVQTALNSAYYGTGLRGAEGSRLRESKDSRISSRIYFYVDTGNGIRPESGVGRFAHEVQLNNIYDPATRLIPPQGNANAFESAVIDAGFDGYIAPFGRGAAVVLLGPKHDYVPVKSLEAPAFAKKQKAEEPKAEEAKAEPGKYRDVAESLGLSDAQYRASVLGLMTGQTKSKTFETPLVGGIPEVVQWLSQRYADSGMAPLDLKNADDRTALAKMMAAEAVAAIRSAGTAVEWYDDTVRKTLQIMAVKYPELNTDQNARNAFLMAVAISSQTMNVEDNLRYASKQYESFRETGRYPEEGTGKSAPAMAKNFALANSLLNEMGPDLLRRFLQTEFTKRELESIGFKIGGESMDEAMLGSAVFGPKIGFGFYSNLSGNFEPVTMDMWFMRTVGRLTGKLPAFEEELFNQQVAKLRSAIGETGDSGAGVYAADFDQALVDEAMKSDEGAIALARAVYSLHNRQFIKERAKFDAGERKKTKLVSAATAILKSADKPKDSPSSGGERQRLRDVVRQMVKLVEDQTGKRVPPAALQALIWYPEQELYKKLGVKLRVTSQDYAGAAQSLLTKEGFDGKRIRAAAESGPKPARPVAEGAVARPAAAAGAKGEKLGPLKGEERAAFVGPRIAERLRQEANAKPLAEVFAGLEKRGLAKTKMVSLVERRDDAARINYVQENFIDILSELEDSGKVKINCD